MENYLNIYADPNTRFVAFKELIVFGFEVLKPSFLIQEIKGLKEEKKAMDQNLQLGLNSRLQRFIFEYLVDTVRIMIFYENYMKAELIKADFCVHKIDRNNPAFKSLANQQTKRPVLLKEISAIIPFEVIHLNGENTITHPAILPSTIDLNVLLMKEKYSKWFRLDKDLINWLKKIRDERNKIHLINFFEFSLSDELILYLEKTIAFAAKLVQEIVPN